MTLTGSGSLGIGVTAPGSLLDLKAASGQTKIILRNVGNTADSSTYVAAEEYTSGDTANLAIGARHQIKFFTNNTTETARIDSSGRLLVGTSSTSANTRIVAQGNSFSAGSNGRIDIDCDTATPGNGDGLGYLVFGDSAQSNGAWVGAERDGGTWSGSSKPSRLVFSTTADGASSPTERMRITNGGAILLGKTTTDDTTPGFAWRATQYFSAVRGSGPPGYINRLTDDGVLLEFAQDNTIEGTISVSGTTVSYNGAHLSRWSQLPGGAERAEILRGTVLSNIDEMCEWGEEDNEQLNRMKVSDVEGDKNVSGVFQGWDDDDDTYTDDFYCAMTGDFIIRISAGIPVHRGQLLMSAGDGTAKPQDDDIIRSKTIAKVTSNHVTCTYDDGSYCVPCVLMAC
jgi:hypothetical protein